MNSLNIISSKTLKIILGKNCTLFIFIKFLQENETMKKRPWTLWEGVFQKK